MELEAEQAVEGLRKPEGGMFRELESSLEGDASSHAAKRKETLAGGAPESQGLGREVDEGTLKGTTAKGG